MNELTVFYRNVKLSSFRFYADAENMQKFSQMLHSYFRFPPSLSLAWESVSDSKDAPLGRYKVEWQGDSFEFEARGSESAGLADLLNRHAVGFFPSATFNIVEI